MAWFAEKRKHKTRSWRMEVGLLLPPVPLTELAESVADNALQVRAKRAQKKGKGGASRPTAIADGHEKTIYPQLLYSL